MMLTDNLYRVEKVNVDGNDLECLLSLNKHHFIYDVHFPDNPVTPGVCLLQICKDMMSRHTESELFLNRIVNIKFLSVINPYEHSVILVSFSKIVVTTDDGYKCTALIQSEDRSVTFAKLSLAFKQIKQNSLDSRIKKLGICIIIPTYNHAVFLQQLLTDVLSYTSEVIVINDGSTDETSTILASYTDRINILSLPKNQGKGHALEHGMKRALSMGYSYAITMDSDNQHKASDLEAFIETVETHPSSMIIGCRSFHEDNMPAGNKFANRFSNFWFAVQAGRYLPDTQCGYRLYPIKLMQNMRLVSSRYEAELEWLLRLAWRNITLIPLPVHVSYQPKGERISHYKTSTDFFRISLLNTVMFFIAIFYGYPSIIIHKLFKFGKRI